MKGKQKRYLRSLAVNIDAIFQVGKGGLNDALIEQLKDALKARELIKIKVLNNCENTAKELAEEIAAATDSELVQVIGSNVVLYRHNPEKSQIELPE